MKALRIADAVASAIRKTILQGDLFETERALGFKLDLRA